MNDPNLLTATEAARQIRNGHLRPEELLETCLSRIAERENTVHAFACFDPAAARREATHARPGPLHGLPVGVKDILDTADLPTEYRLSHLGRLATTGRCRGRGLGTCSRRGRNWENRHHRVCHPQARPHHQSPQPVPHPWGQLQRFGCRGRRRLLSRRLRYPDRRQRDPPRRVLRGHRLQTDFRTDQPRRHEADVR